MAVRGSYQYDFEDVYGVQWKVDPAPLRREKKDGQLGLLDYFDKSILGEETEEDFIAGKMQLLPKCKIMCRTIISGDRVEIDIYPWYTYRKDIPRCRSVRESREAQKKLNDKNREKRLIRLMSANFHNGDLILTLDYEDYYYPTPEQAKKDIRKYVRKLREARRKQNLPPLKYIYVTEYVPEGEETKKVRIHHHMITNRMDRDLAESLWEKGQRTQCRYARPDDFELEGFAKYLNKLSCAKGHHAFAASKNLEKPVEHKSVTLLTKEKFAKIIRSGDGKAELLESLYQGKLKYLDSTTYISEEYGGFYLYSRLRRKESVWEKKEPRRERAVRCRAYLDYDWRGGVRGQADYSILLVAWKKDGTPEKRVKYGRITGETRGRVILRMAIEALGELRPCGVEFHSKGNVLVDGIEKDKKLREIFSKIVSEYEIQYCA